MQEGQKISYYVVLTILAIIKDFKYQNINFNKCIILIIHEQIKYFSQNMAFDKIVNLETKNYLNSIYFNFSSNHKINNYLD